MKPSRLTVLIVAGYTFVLGSIMVILSAISIAAYKCTFHDGFLLTPESYFFHLFYYRSHHCADTSINWALVGVEQVENITEILRMPDENYLTFKSFQLSLGQLVINCLLVVTSFVALATTIWHIYFASRKISYWVLFAPYCLILHLSMIMDFIGGAAYAEDRLRSFSVDGTMSMLEIFNREEARPLISQINVLYRTAAPNVMFFVSTKGIFLNIISCFALFFVALAGWEVVDGNKLRRQKKVES